MEKRIYYSPLIEVENISFSGALLTSPTPPSSHPDLPGGPKTISARHSVAPVF